MSYAGCRYAGYIYAEYRLNLRLKSVLLLSFRWPQSKGLQPNRCPMLKTFFFITDAQNKAARMLVPGKTLQPGQTVIPIYTAVIYKCS
jgi:hypothetical protein